MIKNTLLAREIAAADEQRLISLANKGIYKRALKDAEGQSAVYEEFGGGVTIKSGSEHCTVKAPLEASICTCSARGMCRHIIAAIIILRSEFAQDTLEQAQQQTQKEEPQPEEVKLPLKEKAKEPEAKKQETLSKNDKEKIYETARLCIAELSGVLKRGLVRAADSVYDSLEIAAVKCHAAKMADAERMMRDTSGRLKDYNNRRAVFDEADFTRKLCRAARHLSLLLGDDINARSLGVFKKEYTDYGGMLEILPIGIRSVCEGEYTGEVYYFLNMNSKDKQRFLSYSDLRPVFYENTGAGRRRTSPEVWGAGVTIKSLMHQRLTLVNAKLSGGSLSSSSQTVIVTQQRADINCSAVRKLIADDLREIALCLAQSGTREETSRMFFFHPQRIEGYEFDKLSQQLIITLADGYGNAARMTAKYTANTKHFIEQLEGHAKKMQLHNEKYFTWLVSAYIQDGELILEPIEMYDFIVPLDEHEFSFSEENEGTAQKAVYANRINELFNEIESRLCELTRSGLGTALSGGEKIVKKCEQYGLEKLGGLAERFFKTAEGYRHSINDSSEQVLEAMAALNEYIQAASKRLSLVSALYNMKNEF